MNSLPIVLLLGPGFLYLVKPYSNGSTKRLKIKLLHFFPFLCALIACNWPTKSLTLGFQDSLAVAGIVHVLVYACISLTHLYQNGERSRGLFLRATAIIAVLMSAMFAILEMKDDTTIYNALCILMILFLIGLGTVTLVRPNFLTSWWTDKYKSSSLSIERRKLIIDRLEAYFLREKPHLSQDISLTKLATSLHVSTHHLSQSVNEHYSMNFFNLLNYHRVQAAKKYLVDQNRTDATVEQIAFDVGFNSLSAFYSAFKKFTGMTPKQFHTSQMELKKLQILKAPGNFE